MVKGTKTLGKSLAWQNKMFKNALSQFKSSGFSKAGRGLTKHPNVVGIRVAKDAVQKKFNEKVWYSTRN
jgi:hypothetical protein